MPCFATYKRISHGGSIPRPRPKRPICIGELQVTPGHSGDGDLDMSPSRRLQIRTAEPS
jgi:hypothetical protein